MIKLTINNKKDIDNFIDRLWIDAHNFEYIYHSDWNEPIIYEFEIQYGKFSIKIKLDEISDNKDKWYINVWNNTNNKLALDSKFERYSTLEWLINMLFDTLDEIVKNENEN